MCWPCWADVSKGRAYALSSATPASSAVRMTKPITMRRMLKGVLLACPCTDVSLNVPSASGLIWTLHMCLQSCTLLVLFRANDAEYVHQAMTGHTEQKSCAIQHIPDQRGMVCSTAWRSYLDWADISSWHLGFSSRAICGGHGICTSSRNPSCL